MSETETVAIPTIPVTNPEYGSGVFRRRIRLLRSPGSVLAELEDCHHGFRAVVEYDNDMVVVIKGDALRTPLTTCPAALSRLQRLVGVSTRCSAAELVSIAGASANCTHWLDLTVLAIGQINREEDERLYDVVVSDENNGESELQVYRNGKLVHDWRAAGMELLDGAGKPTGQTLFRGFTAWASKQWDGDEMEAAVVLQRGNFVAQSRRIAPLGTDLEHAVSNRERGAVCYSYSTGIVEHARFMPDSVRDFTDTPEQLLRFV